MRAEAIAAVREKGKIGKKPLFKVFAFKTQKTCYNLPLSLGNTKPGIIDNMNALNS